MKQFYKQGFTLVELSIVLVIIGLLIGGILVGQSLIESAKINRSVQDIFQYEVAVKQFMSKFKQIPGDSSYFTPAGNNDRALSTAGGCSGVYFGSEGYQVWGQLSQSKMLKANYVAYQPSTPCSGTHASDVNDPTLFNVIGPITEANDLGKHIIYWDKYNASIPLNMTINSNPIPALGIESKIGFKSNAEVLVNGGLTNLANAAGICYGSGSGSVNCTDPTARYSVLYYYIK